MKKLIIFLLPILLSCTKQMNNQNLNTMAKGNHGKPTTPPVTTIPKPTGLIVNVVGSTRADILWNAVPNATSYWIRRDPYVLAIITTNTFIDGTLSPGTTYTYRIAAVVNSVLGPDSDPVTITTPN